MLYTTLEPLTFNPLFYHNLLFAICLLLSVQALINMKKIIPIVAVILSACATSSAYLDVGGAAWRKTEAFSAPLFAVGTIETTGRNRFEPKGKVILKDFSIEANTEYHTEETAVASLEAEGKWAPNVAEISGDLKTKKEERLKSKSVIFRTLDVYGLIDKLNEPVNTRRLERLKAQTNPVIVTAVAKSYENDISKKTDFSIRFEGTFSSGSDSPIVKLKGASGSEIKAGFSDGTVFAYEYSQIEWDSSSQIAKIEQLVVDRPANPWF